MTNPVNEKGIIRWYHEGRLHRLDGPASIHPDGSEFYYQNGKLHRLDGPASIVKYDGELEYWVNGEIPLTILDLIITDREMIFDGELVPEVIYVLRKRYKAYRFSDPDELALAVLYYS